jgi:hypothetical protein
MSDLDEKVKGLLARLHEQSLLLARYIAVCGPIEDAEEYAAMNAAATKDAMSPVGASFANVTIHTTSGEKTYSGFTVTSDTINPAGVYVDERYPDGRPVEPHRNEMPYMPGGVGVSLDIYPHPDSIADERRQMEKPEGSPHKITE